MKFSVGFAMFLTPFFVSAQVVINEIAWMGSPPKAGESASVASNNEWIELYNRGSEAVDLGGWMLAAIDGQPSIALSGSVAAGGYFLFERTNDETVPSVAADLIYTGALSNSGEKLELKNADGTIVDSIDATSGWLAGDNTTKETMQRTSGDEWITATATPRAANEVVANQEAGGNTSNVPQTFDVEGPAMIQEQKRFFTVDAGDDMKTVAGAEVRFQGAAFGFTGEPLQDDAARYLWNFGDGAFFEGKNTNHIYRYPGAYRAALYVSSGETSGSDVIEVVVRESSIAISEIAGAWIELVNEGTAAVDMSSWQIRNGAGQIYALPAHTIIGPAAFVVFSQETTGLFFGPVNPKAELRYANGTIADALSFAGTLLPDLPAQAGKSITRDEEGNTMIGEQTPGRKNVNYESGIMPARQSAGGGGNQGKKERNNIQQAIPIAKQEEKQAMIHDSSFMIQPEELSKTELPEKAQTLRASLTDSNYFWLAVSISVGLIAGAVVLALRTMLPF